MTEQSLKLTLLLIGFIVAVTSFFYTVQFASECHDAGGAVVKGIILWECIK
jgi:hypothetical protein